MAITAHERKKMLDELGDKVLLLDVRHAHEYEWGHIPGAVLLDNDDIEEGIRPESLPEDLDHPIIIYCRSGVRSHYAMLKLQAAGYTHVYDMGGIIDWPYEIEK